MDTSPAEFCYVPAFRILAEGKDITAALQQRLTGLTLTDNGGTTARSDELKITLLSETLKLPPKGARLRVALGFNRELTDKGWYVVCGVASSGPPRSLTLYATAAPMNAARQPGDVLSQKTRSWEDMTVESLVRTVAASHGLIPRVAQSLASKRTGHIDQIAESDANLLSRIASRMNAVSKPSGGYWLFLGQGAALTASGKKRATAVLTPDLVSRWTYSEGERGSMRATGEKNAGPPGSIGVRYYDEADGRTRTATADHEGPPSQYPYTQPASSQALQKVARGKMQAARNARKMSLSGPCTPELLALTAESRVQTRGFGEREDTDWLTESLIFSLTPAGLSYSINLVKDTAATKVSPKKQQNNGPDYFG